MFYENSPFCNNLDLSVNVAQMGVNIKKTMILIGFDWDPVSLNIDITY